MFLKMKTLTIILLALSALTTIIGLAIWLMPTTLVIETEATVLAPAPMVYQKVSHLGQFHTWSPWLEKDPKQRHYVTGTDGSVGSQYHWEGVAENGTGSQTITSLKPNELVLVDCHITAPFESKPQFGYHFAAADGGNKTQASIVFTLEMGRPFNVISRLIGLRAEIEASNVSALQNLKRICESEALKAAVRQPLAANAQ